MAHSQIRVFRPDGVRPWIFGGKDDEPTEPLKRIGVRYLADPESAEIVVARAVAGLRPFSGSRKRLALWTDEPRQDLHRFPLVRVPGIAEPVHVMNAYTGNIFTDNYLFMFRHTATLDRDQLLRTFAAKPNRAAILATYEIPRHRYRWFVRHLFRRADPKWSVKTNIDGSMEFNGVSADLFSRRQALAIFLYRRGFCDIYGRHWPPWIRTSREDRGGLGNLDAKGKVLAGYAVNVAFENTIIPHYVTEKIWDAVKAGCLPVYHGASNGIYDDFPDGSFIEAAGKTNAALADEIMNMPRSEAADRYEACLDVYQRIVADDRHRRSIEACRERTAAFLERVMEGGEV